MKFTAATCLFFFGFSLLRPAHGLEAIIKKHHGGPADVLKSIESVTNKAHEAVKKSEAKAEEEKTQVVDAIAAAKSELPKPETPEQKSALQEAVVGKAMESFKAAENAADKSTESLESLKEEVQKAEIEPMAAAQKLGEIGAEVEKAKVLASTGTAMEKNLASDTAAAGNTIEPHSS